MEMERTYPSAPLSGLQLPPAVRKLLSKDCAYAAALKARRASEARIFVLVLILLGTRGLEFEAVKYGRRRRITGRSD